jgi:hypothetical protein
MRHQAELDLRAPLSFDVLPGGQHDLAAPVHGTDFQVKEQAMNVRILALSLATLCIPGAALAQNAPGQPMTTTSSVSCSGSGAAGKCTLNKPLSNSDAAGAGALGNTTPGTTGGSTLGSGSSTTGAGTLNNTTPGATGGSSIDNGSGTAGTLNNTTPGATGGSSVGNSTTGTTGATGSSNIVPTTPGSSMDGNGAGGTDSGGAGGGLGGAGSSGGGSSGSSGGGSM